MVEKIVFPCPDECKLGMTNEIKEEKLCELNNEYRFTDFPGNLQKKDR